uniref:Putative secreted protein n=1 Tax=Anopheles marajoara TaxID=58244 RepID=A0A2M4CDU1_9DIPT
MLPRTSGPVVAFRCLALGCCCQGSMFPPITRLIDARRSFQSSDKQTRQSSAVHADRQDCIASQLLGATPSAMP